MSTGRRIGGSASSGDSICLSSPNLHAPATRRGGYPKLIKIAHLLKKA
jgi:hypothetical protein